MSERSQGKRLAGLEAEGPAGEAARATLEARLEDVERLLTRALGDGSEDERTIHRLRVSTRRASAALRVFKAWVPKSSRTVVGDQLRRVRRTAGEARMCDVQLVQFRELLGRSAEALGPAIGVVVGRIVESRVHAGASVRALGEDEQCHPRALRRARTALVDSIGGPKSKAAREGLSGMTLRALASEQMPELVARMEAAGAADLGVVDNVHALRIVGKRLRYATEIFEACFEPASHVELLARLTDFQDHLGELNDLWEMIQRVERYASDAATGRELADGLDRLRLELSGRFDRAHRGFLAWWASHGIGSIVSGLEIPGRPAGGGGDGDAGRAGASPGGMIESTARHT